MNLVKKVLKSGPAIAFSASFLVSILIFAAFGYAPFGLKSVAGADANIQYLDLFAYLKDVLAGKNSVTYTMSALLGGDEVATFAYYLMSPLNLLVVFFQKSQLPIFYDILLALKLSLAASSMAIFLKQRFPKVPVKSGWKATNNGKKAEISSDLDTFMKLKLKPGVNKIQLTYSVPKLKLGSLISGLVALALLLVAFWLKIRQRSRK